ncbi:hypothetical protein [Amycolatopsis sp. NPDC004625]|uniref:hypothetical protein n=1 Tax=Amycolatopsis sp. NPDC004625 TaxID=3154670 RepID=UPI0033B57BEB
MTRWIDDPKWHDATARLLHKTLGDAYYRVDDLIEIYTTVGLPPQEIHWDQKAGALWPVITRDCADAGKLGELIDLVKCRKPATAGALDTVLAARVSGANWYSSADRHLSHLLGPGCARALLDRRELRAHLRDLAEYDYPVLSITGEPGSGKSYSRHLIGHIANDPALVCDFLIIDMEDEFYDRVELAGFMTILATRLGLAANFEVDPHTEESRQARELVNIFVGRYAQLPRRLRWIFVDGLDRPTVQPAVRIAVAQLAKEVEAGQLPKTRLIVTGHPGDFSPAVLEVLRHEELADLTWAHVHGFFRGIAQHIGRELPEQHLAELVDRVVAEADLTDLRLLGAAASRAAHAHFGPGTGS